MVAMLWIYNLQVPGWSPYFGYTTSRYLDGRHALDIQPPGTWMVAVLWIYNLHAWMVAMLWIYNLQVPGWSPYFGYTTSRYLDGRRTLDIQPPGTWMVAILSIFIANFAFTLSVACTSKSSVINFQNPHLWNAWERFFRHFRAIVEFFLHLPTLFLCNHTDICRNFKTSISVFCFARKKHHQW